MYIIYSTQFWYTVNRFGLQLFLGCHVMSGLMSVVTQIRIFGLVDHLISLLYRPSRYHQTD